MVPSSQQLGAALGLVIFSALATARTGALLGVHAPRGGALTGGFQRALLPGELRTKRPRRTGAP